MADIMADPMVLMLHKPIVYVENVSIGCKKESYGVLSLAIKTTELLATAGFADAAQPILGSR